MDENQQLLRQLPRKEMGGNAKKKKTGQDEIEKKKGGGGKEDFSFRGLWGIRPMVRNQQNKNQTPHNKKKPKQQTPPLLSSVRG